MGFPLQWLASVPCPTLLYRLHTSLVGKMDKGALPKQYFNTMNSTLSGWRDVSKVTN